MSAYICSFDYRGDCGDIPSNLRKLAKERWILKNATHVSCFWICETQARANRVSKWIKEGKLVFGDASYPWGDILKCELED